MKPRLSLLTLALLGLSSNVALATVATVPAPYVSAGSQHRYFGLLQSTNGTAIMLRLRDGRLLAVDASEAFALNRVSEPLFAGKSTVVEGIFAANGVFHASAVKRAAPRPASWGLDR